MSLYQADPTAARKALFDLLRPWALAATGLPEVIEDRPGAPRPQPPYGMLNLISAGRRPHAWCVIYDGVDINGTERVVERRAEEWRWTFSVNVYGEEAFDTGRLLQASLEIGSVLVNHFYTGVRQLPIVVRNVSDLRRIPDLVENVWEERVNFDLTIAGTVLDGFLIDVVDRGTINFVPWPAPVELPSEYSK